jgi:nicotinamidase-related amidase
MKALLVIDMLNDFIEEKGVLYCGETARKIIPQVKKLIQDFLTSGEPVIYLCDSHEKDDEEFRLFPSHCVKGSWGAEVVEELKPEKDNPLVYVIEKTRFSGFYKTELEELLKKLKVDELWLTGVCTSICVMDTAKDAYERGFKLTVVKDAVADFDPEFHQFALKRMERIYGAKIV